MPTVSRSALAAAIVIATALLAPPAARACSCVNNWTLQEEFDLAACVFAGTVTDIQPAGDGFNEIVTLAPTVRWKGGLEATVMVLTGIDDGVCGCPFQVGESYLGFAWNTTFNTRPMLFTHSCSRTSNLAGNPYVPLLPPPVLPVPARRPTWGSLKSCYR